MSNKQTVFETLRGGGLSLALVCGIMANIQRESSYNPKAKGDSGTSYGLCQWHKDRWQLLKDFCSKHQLDDDTIEGQIKFMLWEFRTNFSKVWEAMAAVPDNQQGAYDAAYTMCTRYEIPANKTVKGEQRGALALLLYSEYGGSGTSSETGAYIVQSGDTLLKIASRHGMKLSDLLSLNPQITDPDKIKVGQPINVQDEQPSSTGSDYQKAAMIAGLRDTIKQLEEVVKWLST